MRLPGLVSIFMTRASRWRAEHLADAGGEARAVVGHPDECGFRQLQRRGGFGGR